MDPDSGTRSNNTGIFVDCSAKTPEISFKEELGIKYFEMTSMIDDTESIVLSNASFDSDYNLLHGEVYLMRLEYNEYSSVKKALGKEVALKEMLSYRFNPIETILLTTGPNGRKYEKLIDDELIETHFRDTDFSDLVLEDRMLSNTTDYMNNYLIKYGICRGLSADTFKDFEQTECSIDKANIIAFQKTKVDKIA